MESGKAVILLASTMTLLALIGSISAKPTDQQLSSSESHYELQPIDICIFGCDHCFKADALVKCANECILSQATVAPEWVSLCPYLSRQYTHPLPLLPNNPYRH
ncbi:unnamed protein product [Orchesella dallaii]|uniref:Uncharacterized protein n=1 Tax=Orchesella dallaii TaxID=48710 RepID=A0ABP1R041_9HEXA